MLIVSPLLILIHALYFSDLTLKVLLSLISFFNLMLIALYFIALVFNYLFLSLNLVLQVFIIILFFSQLVKPLVELLVDCFERGNFDILSVLFASEHLFLLHVESLDKFPFFVVVLAAEVFESPEGVFGYLVLLVEVLGKPFFTILSPDGFPACVLKLLLSQFSLPNALP